MEPTGSPFRRPSPRGSYGSRRGRFGPLPAVPAPALPRGARRPRPRTYAEAAAGRRAGRVSARLLGAAGVYLVAVLALVGAALALTGQEPAAVVGLGLTRFSDALAAGTGHAHALAAVAHALAVAGFVLLGALTQRGRLWALATAAGVYALDGLIVLGAHDWVAVAIHTGVLVLMVRGLDPGRRRF